MKKQLILFTASFPYGKVEQFLEPEIAYLAKSFKKIIIIPSSYMGNSTMRQVPRNVEVTSPIMGLSKTNEFFKQVFNLAPISFMIKEIIESKAYKKKELLSHCIRISLRARGYLSNPTIQKLFKTDLNDSVVYFYWGCYTNTFIQLLPAITAPIIVRYHGSDLYTEVNKGGVIFFQKKILQSLDYAVFISNFGKKYIAMKHPELAFDARVFRLGIIDKGIGQSSKDDILRVVSCSNTASVKRVHLIIETLKHLNITAEWTHIGDGTLLKKLKQDSLSLPNNIHANFTGSMDNKILRDFYKNSPIDIFLNVSESEGIPVSVMEALSAGIPVFATDVGGTSELIDDAVGGLIDKNFEPKHLAEKIEHFYSLSTDEKINIRNNARKKWELTANADKVFPEFIAFLQNCTKQNNK